MTVLTRAQARQLPDRVSREAVEVHPGRALLTALAAVLYVLGWLAGTLVMVVVRACVWAFTAVRIGWADARAVGRRGPA